MGFEQIPNTPIEPIKEKDGYILENGIWRKRTKEEDIRLIDQDKESDDTTGKEADGIDKKEEEVKKSDKRRRELDEEYEKLTDKEFKTPEDTEKIAKTEEEHQGLSEQVKETDKTKEEGKEEPTAAKAMEDKEKRSEENEEKEKLEKELTKKYYDELEKIKQMPDDNKNLKAKKCFELINDWKDVAYLDNYKGIQDIFSELNKSKPSIFLYNYKKAEMIDEVAIAMASNYTEWAIEDKEKLKIIKSFVKKQSKEKNFWYGSDDKDATLKDIAQILALKDIPFKGNLDIIIKDIENPNTKSKTIAKILEIEKETIEEKKELLKEMKENATKEKMPPEEKIKEQLKEMGASSVIEKILQDPEALSKIFYEASEISKNPEIQEKFQELQDIIKKIIKEKEKGEIPEAVKKAEEHIKKEQKESPWGTAFGAAGWGILLFLVLFILAELKGVDYLSGQATGKKKEKK